LVCYAFWALRQEAARLITNPHILIKPCSHGK